jgi:ribonucleoside-diphosphate reductase alpha chain
VRIPNDFFATLEADGDWQLKRRIDGKVSKTIKARDLWDQIAWAAWICADPGTQYDTTINEWHTCPEDGRINASNPCSEYMFLDDTACNLLRPTRLIFSTDAQLELKISSTPCVLTIVLRSACSWLRSQPLLPRRATVLNLGLGYANLGRY